MKTPYGAINISPSDIDAVLVTHEHSDHIQSIGTLSKKFDIPIFTTKETLSEIPSNQLNKISDKNKKNIVINQKITIGEMDILPFSIPHDAANPCGFTISSTGHKISIATDIGHMTNEILKNIDGSDFILIESNYDSEVLKCSKYPFSLKKRIAGPSGHLSNIIAGKTINYLIKNGLKKAMLGHLSKESNFPELAYQTVINELLTNGTNLENFNLSVATRDTPSKLIHV